MDMIDARLAGVPPQDRSNPQRGPAKQLAASAVSDGRLSAQSSGGEDAPLPTQTPSAARAEAPLPETPEELLSVLMHLAEEPSVAEKGVLRDLIATMRSHAFSTDAGAVDLARNLSAWLGGKEIVASPAFSFISELQVRLTLAEMLQRQVVSLHDTAAGLLIARTLEALRGALEKMGESETPLPAKRTSSEAPAKNTPEDVVKDVSLLRKLTVQASQGREAANVAPRSAVAPSVVGAGAVVSESAAALLHEATETIERLVAENLKTMRAEPPNAASIASERSRAANEAVFYGDPRPSAAAAVEPTESSPVAPALVAPPISGFETAMRRLRDGAEKVFEDVFRLVFNAPDGEAPASGSEDARARTLSPIARPLVATTDATVRSAVVEGQTAWSVWSTAADDLMSLLRTAEERPPSEPEVANQLREKIIAAQDRLAVAAAAYQRATMHLFRLLGTRLDEAAERIVAQNGPPHAKTELSFAMSLRRALSEAEARQTQSLREHDGLLTALVKQIAAKLTPSAFSLPSEERATGQLASAMNDPAAAVRMLQARILPTQIANALAGAPAAAAPSEATPQTPTLVASFILPLKVDGELWPARLEIRREEAEERGSRKDGENAEQADGRVWTASLDVVSQAIGRISFRLALMPKEFVGTVHLSVADAVEAAREEAAGLEERLRQAGLPEPRIIVSGGFGATETAGAGGANVDEYLRAD